MHKPPPRIYWDACAWIAFINKEMPADGNAITRPRFEMCRDTLKRAESGDIEIVTSAFTLAEVCKRQPDQSSPAINLAAFFDQKYILLVPVDKQIALQAQHLQLAGVIGLKPPDAIHLASALVANVPTFHTFDKKLLGLDKKLTLAEGNELAILRPTEEIPMPELLKAMQPDDPETASD
jgi:predicted nucleic acid-binding protein